MKKFLVLALVGMALTGAEGQAKLRYTAPSTPVVPRSFPLSFHVTHSYLTQGPRGIYQHLVGVLDGANVELAAVVEGGDLLNTAMLPTGEYHAQLAAQQAKKGGALIRQYDVAYPGGEYGLFAVIGLSD